MDIAKRSSTDFIAVHCSATKPSMDWSVLDIKRVHMRRGWLTVGYHFVIKRDGTIQEGRPMDSIGAHVKGYNHNSIGICMVGGVSEEDVHVAEDNFTSNQFDSLFVLLKLLQRIYPDAVIQGHRDFPDVNKACPSFDVKAFFAHRTKSNVISLK